MNHKKPPARRLAAAALQNEQVTRTHVIALEEWKGCCEKNVNDLHEALRAHTTMPFMARLRWLFGLQGRA